MNNFLKRIPLVKRFFENDRVASGGRWHLQYGQSADFKANMSNEDHCGTCATYSLIKQKENVPALQPIRRDIVKF